MKIYLHTSCKLLAVSASRRVRNDTEQVVTNLKIENSSTVTGLGSSQRRVKAASLQINWGKFVFYFRKCIDKKEIKCFLMLRLLPGKSQPRATQCRKHNF